jgi:predicted AlkP superfamily pyrophosphatase or phosphodiesterase
MVTLKGMRTTLLCAMAMALHAAPPRVIVLVIDGLRPDLIRADLMPNLYRMKTEGAWFDHAHSMFPTVTRVNSASISTGSGPSTHGITSNTMWVEAVSDRPFDTANYQNLVKLAAVSGGRALPVPTLAELLEAKGVHFVAMGSGSTGASFLLNPQAPSGTGTLISPGFEDGKRAAFPDRISEEILREFGNAQADGGVPSLLWTEKVLRGYVLPKLHPDVIIDWMTEPDGTQHRTGVGSQESLKALKAVDEQIGLLLDQLKGGSTDIIVTADHGFSATPDPLNLNAAVEAAGKITVVSQGSSALFYAQNRDPEAIQKLVVQLEKTDGVDVVFTASGKPHGAEEECHAGKELGWVPGTFALELVSQCSPRRGPDVMVSFHWSSKNNEFGFPGYQQISSADPRKGVPGRSGHGGLNPYMVHTPLLFWGPDFRSRAVLDSPVANCDIAPTILKLQGIAVPSTMTGRVIGEAFSKGKPTRGKTRTVHATAGSYCGELQISTIAGHVYVDRGNRCGG